ncbi:MAG: ABC transporter permease [Acidimicrobiales bacterium]|jgi:ABC-type dipeptide/oligopeptide/nickel transport system permease subunit|nr:ABC transporter permease [Acidimicrobiales bacterium]
MPDGLSDDRGIEPVGPNPLDLPANTLPSDDAPYLPLDTFVETPSVGDVAPTDALTEVYAARSFRQDAWRRFKKNKLAMFGLFLVVGLVVVAVLGPFLVQDPLAQDKVLFRTAPDADHWFGTDQVGRDVLARVVYGVRLSLFIGFVVVLLETFIGITVGSVAGWLGGLTDSFFMRLIDVLLGIPYLVLAFVLIAVVGRGVGAVIFVLALTSWLTTARVVRAGFLQAKQYEYVEAARAVGIPSFRIVWRHILPNVIQPIIVLVAVGIGSAVLAEAALSYLGVGVQEPTPSLGLMVSRSRSFFSTDPHLLLFPGFAIMITVLAFLLVGDGLRDALDVKES